jgi:mRNA interferase RelE/StbE
MDYEVEFKPKALKDLDAMQTDVVRRVIEGIGRLQHGLEGDVKRLTNFTPEYRLRVGDYRVLFEVEGNRIIVYRVRHRREVYR